jgi:hypothetical protein
LSLRISAKLDTISMCSMILRMEYLWFWIESIYRAFSFSRGALEMIWFLLAIGGGLGALKVIQEKAPKLIKAVEDVPCLKTERSRNVTAFLLLFMGYVVLVGPYQMYREEYRLRLISEHKTDEYQVATLSFSNNVNRLSQESDAYKHTVAIFQIDNNRMAQKIAETDPTLEAVKKRALTLGAELRDFLNRWKAADTLSFLAPWSNDPQLTPEENFQKQTELSFKTHSEAARPFQKEYFERFEARIRAIKRNFDDLSIDTKELGLDVFRDHQMRAADQFSIEIMASSLLKLCKTPNPQ